MDQYGQVIGVLVAEKRDPSATGRFVTHALEHGLRSTHQQPDQAEPGALQSPPAADAGLTQSTPLRIITTGHAFVRTCAAATTDSS
jgi:hypothetical protein